MMRAAVLCLLLACAHAERLDQRATLAVTEQEHVASHIEQGPTRTVEVDEYEPDPVAAPVVGGAGRAAAPAARVARAPRLLRRTITTEQLPIGPAGPAVRIDTAREADFHGTAAAETHAESKTSVAFGFQLWLVLIPAALIGAGLLVWRLHKWIP